MIEFLKNIIPRIKKYSNELDKTENFVDKDWVFINNYGEKEEYIFERDNKLVMTDKNGTKIGSWRLLPTGHLLVQRSKDDYEKLANMFIQQACLILQRSSNNDKPFVLINQQLIPDLNVVSYLKKFEQEQEIKKIPEPRGFKYRKLPCYTNKGRILIEYEMATYPKIKTGLNVFVDENPAPDGKYKIEFMKYIHIRFGMIAEITWY